MELKPHERIWVALDTPVREHASRLTRKLANRIGGIKLGKESFTANGPEPARALKHFAPVFLDLKFHDIPNTVAGAVRAAMISEPAMLTLHASGGPAMMEAAATVAAECAKEQGCTPPKLLGVTVLTSLDDSDLEAVGQKGPVAEQVMRLARLAQASGLDGVICSPHEVRALREACGSDFMLVVPGIRPRWAMHGGDQKRVMTPAQAMAAGADLLVIGRPIVAAEDPGRAAERIAEEIADA